MVGQDRKDQSYSSESGDCGMPERQGRVVQGQPARDITL